MKRTLHSALAIGLFVGSMLTHRVDADPESAKPDSSWTSSAWNALSAAPGEIAGGLRSGFNAGFQWVMNPANASYLAVGAGLAFTVDSANDLASAVRSLINAEKASSKYRNYLLPALAVTGGINFLLARQMLAQVLTLQNSQAWAKDLTLAQPTACALASFTTWLATKMARVAYNAVAKFVS